VEPGIFSILPVKFRFGTKNSERDQSLAGKFPSPVNWEFIRA